MRILSARIAHARHDRDFGQVEALVALLVKAEGRPVPFEITIRTAEPAHGPDLRQRLLNSARALHDARRQLAPPHVEQPSGPKSRPSLAA